MVGWLLAWLLIGYLVVVVSSAETAPPANYLPSDGFGTLCSKVKEQKNQMAARGGDWPPLAAIGISVFALSSIFSACGQNLKNPMAAHGVYWSLLVANGGKRRGCAFAGGANPSCGCWWLSLALSYLLFRFSQKMS